MTMSLMSNNSFIFRTWAYFYLHLYSKSVSLVTLIVSTWVILYTLTILSLVTFILPVTLASTPKENNNLGYSNITLLDLYPELKEYLWKKAVNDLKSSSSTVPSVISQAEDAFGKQGYAYGQNGWPNEYTNSYNGVGNPTIQMPSNTGSVYGEPGDYWNSRGGELDSDPEGSYNYQKEVLKYWQPFGSPEFYDSWKFKHAAPHQHVPPPSPSSHGWTNSIFPFWEEEETETVSHELSKDFSCLAGLLGLKTLKKLKFAAIFKKVKILGIFLVAFKLGILLSPVAIPLLFPIILLVTVVKVLPLIIIIILLLKILKKQIKIKKPFGKYLDQTSSLFFDNIETLTDKVLSSDDEYVEKISSGISKKSNKRSSKGSSTENKARRVNSKSISPNFAKIKNNTEHD